MSFRSVLIVLLALVFGGAAALGITVMRRPEPPPPPPQIETVPVVVAATDVARFTTISSDHLRVKQLPKDAVPPNALTRIEDAAGRVTLVPLYYDEPVLDVKLASHGAGRGMAPGIEKGKRAFTIQTPNVASGVAGFILPGNKVDVLLTVSGNGANDPSGGGLTVTLLQDVEILAVDQRVEAPADNKVDANQLRSVTLLVTPNEAAKLDLGQNKGTLHLSLRNPEDTVRAPTRKATLVEIGLLEEKPVEPDKSAGEPSLPPPPLEILAVRGTQQEVIYLRPVAKGRDGR